MTYINHSNPSDFGITQEEADKMKLRYLKGELQFHKGKFDTYKEFLEGCTHKNSEWYLYWMMNEATEAINNIKKRISFYNTKKDKDGNEIKRESIDIDVIKSVPILDILKSYNIKLERTGNMRWKCKLRNENTASTCIYENTNSWSDFGTGEGGSVIDLVCKLENKSVFESIKILKNYL